ncbi:Zinc dependent phospholipase C [Malonomonas rubra DSM 5091]|uniref:Zinc dependent phospholipase C n=1 Tax=Malonomonas rubra DSM 5091 TaxID=1122189 RepID=A0A1M6DJ06_MALRU|nr:zinc dependent phospholipase C family protein [Malonomonas rubra]SHI73172.1 Zinc dependent phospholipase C [Malonomonas rubra DSM 5091]
MRILLLVLTLCILPADAFAWGVGVHLSLGSCILEANSMLPAALANLLTAYPLDYLYGCVAADITLGKKFTHYLDHCHNWRVGNQILEHARKEGPEAEACAYGYLSHLAADTVAHNYYVPLKLSTTFNTVLHNHAYWEVRAEFGIADDVWELAEQLSKRDNSNLDNMLSRTVSKTLFSFGTNKQLFNSMMLVSRLQRWHKILRTVANRSKFQLDDTEHSEYLLMALEAISGILSDPESPYWNADPTGDRALAAAKQIRKNMNMLWLDGKLLPEDSDLIIEDLRTRFKLGITNPDELLPLLTVA